MSTSHDGSKGRKVCLARYLYSLSSYHHHPLQRHSLQHVGQWLTIASGTEARILGPKLRVLPGSNRTSGNEMTIIITAKESVGNLMPEDTKLVTTLKLMKRLDMTRTIHKTTSTAKGKVFSTRVPKSGHRIRVLTSFFSDSTRTSLKRTFKLISTPTVVALKLLQ